MFLDILWDGKPAKVKLNTITGAITEGGLKMPHVGSIIEALKLTWLSRYLNDNITGKWKLLSEKLMNISKKIITSKTDLRRVSRLWKGDLWASVPEC